MSQLARMEYNAAILSPLKTSVARPQYLTCWSKDRRDRSETLLQRGQSRTAALFKFILEPVARLRILHCLTDQPLEPGKAQLLNCGSIPRFLHLLVIVSSCATLPNKTPLPAAPCSTPTPIAPISALPHRFNC